MSGATYLVTVVYVWLCVVLLQNLENFIGSQKFQNKNMLKAILRNLNFFSPDPPPQKNEIAPDLVWYMFGPQKNFCQKFFGESNSFVQNLFFHQISKIFKPKCISGYSEQMTFCPKK